MDISDEIQIPSPIHLLDQNYLDSGLSLYMKRDDLIHPWINGNKWRKLYGHLLHFHKCDNEGIITFGGANSNHLIAVAYVSRLLEIPAVGLVRTYGLDHDSPVVQKLIEWGMMLIPIAPSDYRSKSQNAVISKILSKYPNYMTIPEGGTSIHALTGLEIMSSEIVNDSMYNPEMEILLPIGTGGMLAGLYHYMPASHRFMVTSSFKSDIDWVEGFSLIEESQDLDRINIHNASNGKRFGVYDIEVVRLINEFYDKYGVLLDPIYSTKSMLWLNHYIRNSGCELPNSVLMIHSGGQPGILAYNYLNRKKPRLINIPSNFSYLQ